MTVKEAIREIDETIARDYPLGMEGIKELIHSQAAELERLRGGWIPVSGRLPYDGQEVDIWVERGYGTPTRVSDVRYCTDDTDGWFEQGDMTYEVGEQVTHWRETPEPPKGGE